MIKFRLSYSSPTNFALKFFVLFQHVLMVSMEETVQSHVNARMLKTVAKMMDSVIACLDSPENIVLRVSYYHYTCTIILSLHWIKYNYKTNCSHVFLLIFFAFAFRILGPILFNIWIEYLKTFAFHALEIWSYRLYFNLIFISNSAILLIYIYYSDRLYLLAGCPAMMSGEDCQDVCGCEYSDSCHPVTGKCHCRVGYTGPYCDQGAYL